MDPRQIARLITEDPNVPGKEYLIIVSGSQEQTAILVRGADTEMAAQRAAYEAVYGPISPDEMASDQTVKEYTLVMDLHELNV